MIVLKILVPSLFLFTFHFGNHHLQQRSACHSKFDTERSGSLKISFHPRVIKESTHTVGLTVMEINAALCVLTTQTEVMEIKNIKECYRV